MRTTYNSVFWGITLFSSCSLVDVWWHHYDSIVKQHVLCCKWQREPTVRLWIHQTTEIQATHMRGNTATYDSTVHTIDTCTNYSYGLSSAVVCCFYLEPKHVDKCHYILLALPVHLRLFNGISRENYHSSLLDETLSGCPSPYFSSGIVSAGGRRRCL